MNTSGLLASFLNLLPTLGPILAAAPQFKRHYEEVKAVLKGEEQDVAKRGYDLALQDAAEAHQDLQALVKQYG